jgi:hypothetical protein
MILRMIVGLGLTGESQAQQQIEGEAPCRSL